MHIARTTESLVVLNSILLNAARKKTDQRESDTNFSMRDTTILIRFCIVQNYKLLLQAFKVI